MRGESVLTVGQTVDRYEILSVIGEGGMAVVLEVRHLELGTRHALKVLQISFPGVQERLLHEGQVQAQIRHPNVCRVSDVVRVAGAPGLVMELVEGPAVDGMLGAYQPSLPQIDAVARGIVAGVRAAHVAGVIHRDLKPSNVLMAVQDDRLLPKVTDFGLAKAIDDGMEERGKLSTRTGTHMGTPAYMAPEQFRDAKRADQRADIFSLGCVLYELVSGYPAFSGNDAVEVYQSTSNGRFHPLQVVAPSLPQRMADAVTAALSPDPDQRPASCDALLAIWCGDVPDDRVAVEWESSHLEVVRSLAPTRQRGGAQSVTIAPSLPTAGPGVRLRGDGVRSVEPSLDPPPVRVPAAPAAETGRYTTAGVAVGLGAAGIAAAVGITLVAGAVGVWWVYGRGDRPRDVAIVTVPVPVPHVEIPEEETLAAAAIDPEPPPAVVEAPAEAAAPEAVKAAPRRPTPKPRAPVAPETVETVVTVRGIDRAWLLRTDGARFKPGDVPPGSYVLQAFFDDSEPTRVMELTIAEGETRTIRCDRMLKVCR